MALYAVIYALSVRWLLVGILLVMGALLLLPCRFLARPETIRGLSSFMVVWIDIVIFVTQIFSQELESVLKPRTCVQRAKVIE